MNTSDARQILAERLKAHLAKPEFALSFPQQRPWFLDQLQKDNPVYNLPLGYRIEGPIDVQALQRALTAIVHRHEILRSTYHTVDGVPKQRVGVATEVPLELIDLTEHAAPEMHAQRIADAEASRPFDLSSGPMLRANLLKVAKDCHWFLLSLHHIACDAWSVGIIAREVSQIYSATVSGETVDLLPNRLQYIDFVEWQSRLTSGPERRVLMEYWKSRLSAIPACINLMTDKPRPPIQDYKGAHITFSLPNVTLPAIDALARQRGTTPFAVLLSTFSALLNRYCGGEQVVIGSPVANRNMEHLESMVGFFTNTLVFHPDFSGNPAFSSLVSRVGEETRLALAHQDLPFEMVVENLRPDRDTAHSPIFQVMFIYWDGDDDAIWTLPGCEFTSLPGDSKTAKFDLTLSLTRTKAGIQARLEYATSLFEKATVERMAEQFVTLLEAALAQPDMPIADILVLPQAERDRVLFEWGRVNPVALATSSIHEMIFRSTRRTPEAVAVIDESSSLTYESLHARAGGVAFALRSLGVKQRDVIGIYLDRSVDTVVALYGVLQTGAAYLPLDPAYPGERLAFMCNDSSAKVVLTSRASAGAAAGLGVTIVCIENCLPREVEKFAESSLDDLAYLIYTSGSTGKPKGVMLTHRNVATFFAAMDATFGGDEPGTWLAVTSISFDISVLELLWTLTRGFRIVIRPDETKLAVVDPPQPVANGQAAPQPKPVDFSLFYFGNDRDQGTDRYDLVLEGARFADANGFAAVWTPERHFHPFGGLFPNPSVIGAAIAAITKRVAVRAGSVVLPLHDTLRVAEEWAVVDNLSKGRVGISFASGWQPDDFVLAPDRYPDRKAEMFRMIEEVRALWRGESIRRRNGADSEIEVSIHPKPLQPELPVWITSARHPDTFRMAGEVGAGLLTHLIGHSAEQLTEKIALYRAAWREGGWPGNGHVTLMLHTFVHPDIDVVRSTVREPLREYIRSSFDLMAGLGAALNVDLRELPEVELEGLLDGAFERFFATSGLLGTPQMVAAEIERLAALGVDEVGCLVDFGVAEDMTLAGMPHLAEARQIYLRKQAQVVQSGPESLATQIERYGVTHLQCTPSLAGILIADEEARTALKSLKRMLVGGEALSPELANALANSVGGTVHNMYGPTEATVWATTDQVRADSPIRIGKPLPGYQAYVVDAQLRPAPIGVPGELVLGGAAIAKGYHNRPELTEERFVPDVLGGSGGRLYRTGDRARWRASGELEFLGRLDFQVKLRGRRIELGEIDAALVSHPSIQAAVCDVRGNRETQGIVAYCVLAAGESQLPTQDVLRAYLSRTLPDHMLPSSYVSLPAFPLTPNGKVDRRALSEVKQVRPDLSTVFVAPKSNVEESIALVWRALLNLPEVGVHDNFFDLGGNSILAVAVRSRLVTTLDSALSLIDMFRYPTIATLAETIVGRRGNNVPPAANIDAVNDAAQKRRAALARKGPARPQEVR